MTNEKQDALKQKINNLRNKNGDIVLQETSVWGTHKIIGNDCINETLSALSQKKPTPMTAKQLENYINDAHKTGWDNGYDKIAERLPNGIILIEEETNNG